MIIGYHINIYPVGLEGEIVDFVAENLKKVFNVELYVDWKKIKWGDILRFLDADREQVNAEILLNWLSSVIKVPPNGRALVMIKGDGYVEGLNFVFGVALPGWGGIVFTARLDPLFYGYEYNDLLFRARLIKEVLHEIGHSYGLSHCRNRCVMRFSNSVYDVDNKPASYCQSCRIRLEHINPGLLRRIT